MPDVSAHTSTRTWASSAPLSCWDMEMFGNAPWEQSFWSLHGLLLNRLGLDRPSKNTHQLGCGEPNSGFFHSNTKINFFPLTIDSPPNFLKNSCKLPWGAAHGRGQPFPGQLKHVILMIYSKFPCPLVSPHDVRGRSWTQHWTHSTRGASPAHGVSN